MKKSSSFNLMGVLSSAAAIATLFTIVLSFISPVRAAMVTAHHVAPITDRFAALPFFDPTLGSLNRVQLGFNFEVPVTLTFSNSSSSPINVSLSSHTLKAVVSHPNTNP